MVIDCGRRRVSRCDSWDLSAVVLFPVQQDSPFTICLINAKVGGVQNGSTRAIAFRCWDSILLRNKIQALAELIEL